jgi:hypothetical protein
MKKVKQKSPKRDFKQITIDNELRKRKDYKRATALLKRQNFKDFAEEMDFINNKLPSRYRDILFGFKG